MLMLLLAGLMIYAGIYNRSLRSALQGKVQANG